MEMYPKNVYKMQQGMQMSNHTDAVHIEMQRMQLELQRRDALIEEQQKRIFQLEDEVKRCNKQIQDLVVQLSNYKDNKGPKAEMNYKPPQSRYWTAEEHERFIEAVKRYGPKDVKAIAQFVGTRNPTQVRTHAQKYYLRLERERKRRDDSDNPNSTAPIDINPESKAMSDDEDDAQNGETVVSEGSIEGEKGSQADEAKKPPRKRASVDKSGRRASLPSDLSREAVAKAQENSAVVHSTRQQLQAAAPIVCQAKGWTAQEYNFFIEGLLAFPEERDISKKCKLISDRFLPKYSAEDIKQCYAILHNYIKKMEEDAYMNDAKRTKTEPGFGGYTTTAMPPDPRYAQPGRGFGSPYTGFPPGVAMSVYNGPEGSFQTSYPPNPQAATTSPYAADPVTMRRGSYPMDSFSLTKAIPTNESSQPA